MLDDCRRTQGQVVQLQEVLRRSLHCSCTGSYASFAFADACTDAGADTRADAGSDACTNACADARSGCCDDACTFACALALESAEELPRAISVLPQPGQQQRTMLERNAHGHLHGFSQEPAH